MRLWRLVLVMALLLGVWQWSPIKAGVVLGGSMEPTLRSGQVILVDRRHYRAQPVRRGDVVTISYGGEVYVKRVHAVAGDTVWELRAPGTQNTIVRPDLRERVARVTQRLPGFGRLVPLQIPEGMVYVLGDAGNNSYDSRDFGPVFVSDILGLVRL
ncbi:MAG: signal peptidase I [Armatimonadetes bacterium]|nr:signal peptidase I [Armatimonadota bacterium]